MPRSSFIGHLLAAFTTLSVAPLAIERPPIEGVVIHKAMEPQRPWPLFFINPPEITPLPPPLFRQPPPPMPDMFDPWVTPFRK